MKPLNKKLRKKMKKLKFECQGCKSILGVNDAGMGQGKHEDFCVLAVIHKFTCGNVFNGTYAEIKAKQMDHLIKECTNILCLASRRLMKLVKRFESLGVPEILIEIYKREPFYFLHQGSDAQGNEVISL